MTNATLILRKSLSPAQQAKRLALLQAAEELAAEGGYEGASMSAVAEMAGVSRATAYLYFASKDHMLVQLNVELGKRSTWMIAEQEHVLGSAASRADLLRKLVRDMVEEGLQKPRLLSAVMSTVTSPEPAVVSTFEELQDLMHERFRVLLDHDEALPEQARTRAAILRQVFNSCLIELSTGLLAKQDAFRQLDTTIALLCQEVLGLTGLAGGDRQDPNASS